MPDAIHTLAVFAIGVVASTIGTMVGGGSLLTIPFLIFLGLPAPVAIATDRFAGLGGGITGCYRFARSGKIVWRYVPALAVTSLAGSLIGATLLVRTEPAWLNGVVGLLLLALLPVLFLKRDLGTVPREVGRLSLGSGLGLYFLIQILAGFFGAGTGTLVFYTLMGVFGLAIVQSVATQIVPFMVLTIASVALFAAHGIVDFRTGVVLMAGTLVGGYLGAHLAIRGGDRWVRRLFALVVVASAVRLLLG